MDFTALAILAVATLPSAAPPAAALAGAPDVQVNVSVAQFPPEGAIILRVELTDRVRETWYLRANGRATINYYDARQCPVGNAVDSPHWYSSEFLNQKTPTNVSLVYGGTPPRQACYISVVLDVGYQSQLLRLPSPAR